MINRYTVRTYNLQANTPQALPSAREYLIVSATVDIQALAYALGDGNADLEQWPFGFAVGVREGVTKARIQSSVAQVVQVAMVEGNAIVRDNRFAPGAGTLPVTIADGADVALGARADAAAASDTATASLIALSKRLLTKTVMPQSYTIPPFSSEGAVGSAATSAVVVAAAANVNGIHVMSMTIACRQDPTAEYSFAHSGVGAIMKAYDSQAVAAAGAFIVPAGVELIVQRTGGGIASCLYRIL